ncbi:CotO family spore coat protein [Amphibacillus indicireducens]|uniref:Spore coat protein CotO n=1 Tax=Amphibacillus indicireducens TaxID=1076330 RepID=A0ABP7V1S1_9BACI
MTLKPLFLIDQPELAMPHAPMQAEYHSPTEADKINSQNQSQPKKAQMNGNQSQVFTEMTTDQKLNYLLTRPAHVPKLYCKFTVNQAYYRGHVLAREADQFVFEDRHTRKRHLFKIADISEIRLIGF